MKSALATVSWVVVACLAVVVGAAATLGNYIFGLGRLIWPLMRPPLDDFYTEGPTERLIFWICAVIGIAIGLAVFVAVSRNRQEIAPFVRRHVRVA
jgi:hypothetical protein